ncbi:hypothetical protein CR513_50005, partial [Mucuna pruriens]
VRSLQLVASAKHAIGFQFSSCNIPLIGGNFEFQIHVLKDLPNNLIILSQLIELLEGHVRWNEDNIGEIEANKPVRQKITEPKTPYHPMLDDDIFLSPVREDFKECIGDKKNHSTNAERIDFNNAACCSRKGTGQSDGWTTSEDETEEIEQDEEGRKKLSYIERGDPSRNNPKFEVWVRIICSIPPLARYERISLIHNSMEKNFVVCYDIESKIFNYRQKIFSVTNCYETLNGLWIELDQY